LLCNSTHVVGVQAFDAAGNYSRATTVAASTSPCPVSGGGGGGGGGVGGGGGGGGDTVAPTVPGALHSAATTATSVSLAWTASTDAVGVAGYGLYLGSALVGTTSTTSFVDTGLVCATSYSFSVDAFDAAGNHSAKAPLTVSTSACSGDTQAPTAPAGLRTTGSTQTSVSLSWTASSDNVGVAGYTVYVGGSIVASPVSVAVTLTSLTCGTTYSVGIEAFDAAGNRSTRTTGNATTSACPPAPDTQAPSAPTGLVSSSATATSITLGWTASTDNVGVSSYGVYQGTSLVGTSATTSYTIGGLSCGTSYSVSADAADAAGNRSTKANATVQTSACPVGGAGTANIFISPTGTGCHRYASPVSYAAAGAANACGPSSWVSACTLAQSGDTIIVEDGVYGSQNLSTCTGHDGYSANVVFEVEPGHECPVYWPNVPAVGTDMSCPVSVSDLNLRTQFTSGGNCPGGGTGHFLPSTLSDFSQWINHLEFHDMYVTGFTTRCVRNLVLSNVDGQNWFLRSAYHVQFLGGSYSNQFTGDCPQIGNFVGPDAPITQDVLLSRVLFHDQRHDNSPATHPDGLFVQDSDTVTITGNVFVRDDVIPLYINGFGGTGVANLTVTNNLIHTPTNHISGYPGGAASGAGGNSLNLGDYPLRNVVIAFNSIEGPIYRHGPGCNGNANPSNTNVAIYGNITTGMYGDCDGNCKATIAYAYNVAYSGGTCAASDQSSGNGYTSSDALNEETSYGDHRLTAGAAAIGLVPTTWCTSHPGVCPSTDFVGTARPGSGHASTVDAGAFENQ
jgi:chitodextrinase